MGPLMVGVPKRNDNYLKDSKHGFFCGKFSPFGDQKTKAHESNKGIFDNLIQFTIFQGKKIKSH
jgi:hypothetical protein